MNLLAPLALLAIGGVALPVVAHLLGRQPPREIAFGALRFLPTASAVVSQRRALRDLPLLLVRAAILVAIALVFARPVARDDGALQVVAEVHDCLLLVDGSGSMGLRHGRSTMFEHAIERAGEVLDALPPGSRVGLITSDPRGPRLEPTAEPERIAQALRTWQRDGAPRLGAWSLADALPHAIALLPNPDARPRIVYAIGDRYAGGLGALPERVDDVAILAVPAHPSAPPEHVALMAATWEAAPDLDPSALRIRATVRRFVAAPAEEDTREVSVALTVDGEPITRASVVLPPNEDRTVEFTHVVQAAGVVPASVRLEGLDGDPWPGDNERPLWLSAAHGFEVLVVNGDPSELRAHDEVYFLTTAVSATEDAVLDGIRVRSMAPDQLEHVLRKDGRSALEHVDIMVLANVRAPAADISPTILDAVRDGMGLWITGGDRVAAQDYNAALDEVLPLRLRDALEVGTAPGRERALMEGLAPPDLAHPVFSGFADAGGLDGTRVRKVLLLEPDANRPHGVALSLTNGAPVLVTRDVGDGRVALLTTTIDRDWSDLPLRPGFVPLVAGTLRWLGGGAASRVQPRLWVGEPQVLGNDKTFVVDTPDGREVPARPGSDGVARFEDTMQPGHYRVHNGDAQQAYFVVEVNPTESDTSAPAEVRTGALPEGTGVMATPRWRIWIWLALGLLGLETVLRRRAVT